MKCKIFSLLAVFSMLLSLLGTALPAFAEATPGQIWYINGDINAGQEFASLTTSPSTPVKNQDTYAWGMGYYLSSPTAVSFPAGDWVVHFTIATPITRTLTFSIKRSDAIVGWGYPGVVLASQVVALNNTTTGTTAVDLTFSLPAFTLTPSGTTPGNLSMWWQEGGSASLTILYGSTNSYLITPPGSPVMACPPYSSNLTITNIQASSAILSVNIPYIGSYSDTTVQFRVAPNSGGDSFFFDATPSPVISNGTTVTAIASGLPANTGYYFYPIVHYGSSGGYITGQSIDFSTPHNLTDPEDAAGGMGPDIVAVDYSSDTNNIYIQFFTSASFSPDNRVCVAALDIDNNTATGSPIGTFGPAGTDYRIQAQLAGPVQLFKFSAPMAPINGITMTVNANNFYFTLPKASLGSDLAQFLDGIHFDTVISDIPAPPTPPNPPTQPTMIDNIVGILNFSAPVLPPQNNGDAYEPDDTPAQASTLIVNATGQAHNFYVANDYDYAKFIATAGTKYTIETYDLVGTDTGLALFGTDGTTVLASNDDFAYPDRYSKIIWTAPTSGTYYIRVMYWGVAFGVDSTYKLRITSVIPNGETEPEWPQTDLLSDPADDENPTSAPDIVGVSWIVDGDYAYGLVTFNAPFNTGDYQGDTLMDIDQNSG
ncbi:MAG: PPC domain-containing protein, partial [Chloroflexi bacterium]|nr:PPC domain-containing protein [Chloroflexota bacterium]